MNIVQFGYGNFGKFHTEAWLALGCKVTVVDPAHAGASHQRRMSAENLQSWTSGDAIVYPVAPIGLLEQADVVDICTPAMDHVASLLDVSRRLSDAPYFNERATKGSLPQIFVEKPVSASETLVRTMSHFRTYVGYGYRFAPGMSRLKGCSTFDLSWMGRKRPAWTARDLLWNDGCHVFDLCKYLTGRFPTPPEYVLSNTMEGFYPDPVVKGARTSKWLDTDKGFVDFSEVHPVDLLKEQFRRLLDEDGKDLHTLQESVALTNAMENALQMLSPMEVGKLTEVP